jgi:peroxiredoxin
MALAEGKQAPDFAPPGEGGATVVAPDGTVACLFPKVKVDGHVREVLAAL